MINRNFTAFTWNIEGLKRNYHSLKHFLDKISPTLTFISEPQIFQCDIASVIGHISPTLCFHLNSEDAHDETLALEKCKSKGGTLLLWPVSIDPYVTILPTTSPAILPCMLKLLGCVVSYHICVYLPTAGKEDEFVCTLATLNNLLEDIYEKHDGQCPVFIRGDGNASSKNTARAALLNHVLSLHHLTRLNLHHNTYHHFIGNGAFDSDLDIILSSVAPGCSESLVKIICKNDNPLINSLHDIIITSFSLPPAPHSPPPTEENITAPRISNDRQKVIWNEEGVEAYKSAISGELVRLRETWGQASSSSPSCMSLFLSSTYSVMRTTAANTNRVIKLGEARTAKPKKSPEIVKLQRAVLSAHKHKSLISASPSTPAAAVTAASDAVTQARSELQRAVRAQLRMDSFRRDSKLTKGFTSLFRSIKSSKAAAAGKISSIRVGNLIYEGESVPDGFFDSMNRLKHPDMSPIHNSPHFQSTLMDFDNIISLCKTRHRIPPISAGQSAEILYTIRAEVNDFYSITANHFINAGVPGLQHHHFILSTIITNVNLAHVEELNTAWSCILYKGHKKDKESDRSYRNICSCPFMAKCIDVYIGRLYSTGWADCQAETQFQGEGSSHELAALLFTETIQHSIYVNKKPVYALALDAMSAFDKIVRQCAIREAFLIPGHPTHTLCM